MPDFPLTPPPVVDLAEDISTKELPNGITVKRANKYTSAELFHAKRIIALQKYSDLNHSMTQQQIADRLKSDYGLDVNRSTVKRNVTDLIDAGYDIQYTEVARSHVDRRTGEKEENIKLVDFHFLHKYL